jgi:hypothetical protein
VGPPKGSPTSFPKLEFPKIHHSVVSMFGSPNFSPPCRVPHGRPRSGSPNVGLQRCFPVIFSTNGLPQAVHQLGSTKGSPNDFPQGDSPRGGPVGFSSGDPNFRRPVGAPVASPTWVPQLVTARCISQWWSQFGCSLERVSLCGSPCLCPPVSSSKGSPTMVVPQRCSPSGGALWIAPQVDPSRVFIQLLSPSIYPAGFFPQIVSPNEAPGMVSPMGPKAVVLQFVTHSASPNYLPHGFPQGVPCRWSPRRGSTKWVLQMVSPLRGPPMCIPMEFRR